jgi:hypothetical protein
MKPSKRPIKGRVLHTPLDLHRFPLNAQADATPSREAVRELAHPITAPRQTKRRSEKNR